MELSQLVGALMEHFLEKSSPLKGFGKIIQKRRFLFVTILILLIKGLMQCRAFKAQRNVLIRQPGINPKPPFMSHRRS